MPHIFLTENFPDRAERDLPLNSLTTYQTGGNADWIVFPIDGGELQTIIKFLCSKGISFFVLGAGSNVLVSDNGYRGVIISTLAMNSIERKDNFLTIDSGTRIRSVLEYCYESNLGGLEFLYGLPATLGGALYMNAGCFNKQISNYVFDVTALDNKGNRKIYKNDKSIFYYRGSMFAEKELIIENATLRLFSRTSEDIELLKKLYLSKRREQPKGPSAGSVFKNSDEPAGKLIEECGLKNVRIGGAYVSDRHANFIINDGTATSSDIFALIKLIEKTVKERFGIGLEREIKLLGEFNDING